VNLQNVTREEQIVGGLALLLAIFLLVLPWFDVSVGPFSATFSATSAPDGWLGILAFIAALAVIADLAIEKFSPQTAIPALGGGRAHTRFILAVVAAAFLVLKFLFHINHFSDLGWGFYVDVIVTAALVYFALQLRNATAPVGGGRPARPVATPTPGAGPTPGSGAGPSAPGPGSTPGSIPPEGPGGSTPPPRV
jgi:hypothetical protein